jgi:L-ascorbate metabolism protein UlaG (beta-lactamase superfamily)
MEITYLGHSCFKLKGKQGTVVTDPYAKEVGFSMPAASADLVTFSHSHADHNNAAAVSTTARRKHPFWVTKAGEYEVAGVSVFGYETFHDNAGGTERGPNIIYRILLDGVNIVHLGDLGHTLDEKLIEVLGNVDVLLCPVGGEFTIDPDQAMDVIQEIEPYYVIPMHYRTDKHAEAYSKLKSVEEFEKVFGVTPEPTKTLSVSQSGMPEQTTLVVLSP